MKCKPLYNKIFVEALPEDESRSKGGLLLPGKEANFQKVKVLDVGNGYYQNAKRIPMDIEIGDILLIPKMGNMLVVKDEPGEMKQFILPDGEVYCKVENEE